MVKESGQWLRRNVATVVTWALILLGVAVAWGTTTAEIGSTAETVTELRQDGRVASTERATIRSDVRVLETRQQALGETIRAAVDAVDKLESVVTRLEALASHAYTPR